MSELQWQRPNKTEEYAWQSIEDRFVCSDSISLVKFPWATWIDLARDTPSIPYPAGRNDGHSIVATVSQHIHTLKHISRFKECGVTDLFWSHATSDVYICDGVRIHPFPLFPVRCSDYPAARILESSARPILYSFRGAYNPSQYISPVRSWISQIPDHTNAVISVTPEWHFEQQVYREQIYGESPNQQRHNELKKDAEVYVDLLSRSSFTLCPSGSGPNSIRIWEALGFGSIPVILSDNLRLPGSLTLWQKAAVFMTEDEHAVKELPEVLSQMRSLPECLNRMQKAGSEIYERYGIQSFGSDIIDFCNNPDEFLLSQVKNRLLSLGPRVPSQSSLNPIVVSSSDHFLLPKQLKPILKCADPSQPIIIQVLSSDSLSLINARWRSTIKLCKSMLEQAGIQRWAVSSRSADIQMLAF